MASKKLLQPGVHERHELPLEEDPVYCQMKFSKATSLAELSEDYQFFTHGLLFTHGGWNRDPINDYVVEYNPEFIPIVIDLPKPIILGMECKDENHQPRADWCYKLLAIRHEGWDSFYDFMSTI